MKLFHKFLALGAIAVATAPLAMATPITTGATVTPSSIASIPGTLDSLYPAMSGTFAGSTFTATYTDSVYKGNMFGANDLSFVISVKNLSGDAIESISTGMLSGSFGPFSLDVDYLTDGAVAPTSVSDTGTSLHFSLVPSDLAPGQTSDTLVIETSATLATVGGLSAQDTLAGNGSGYVPTAATPEPGSLMLLGTGLFGGAATLLRRRRSVSL
jgi:hypothetical protein